MNPNHSIAGYISDFCGGDFVVWDVHLHSFGQCFQDAVLCSSTYALLAIASVYFLGKKTAMYARSKRQSAILAVRIALSCLLFALAVVKPCVRVYYLLLELTWAEILANVVQVIISVFDEISWGSALYKKFGFKEMFCRSFLCVEVFTA